MQLLHDLYIQRLQRVAGGLDEEDDGVDAIVDDVHAVHLVLLVKVGVESLLNVLNNGFPRFVVVDEVTKAGRVNDGQPQADAIFLNVCTDRLYRDGLGDVEARGLALLGRVQRRVEESVHEGGLAEPRFACQGPLELSMKLNAAVSHVPTTITLKLNPLRTLLRCHWLGRFANPTYPVSFRRTMFMSLAAMAASLGSLEEMVWGAEAWRLAAAFTCSMRGDPVEVAGGDGDARVGAAGDAPFDAVSAVSPRQQGESKPLKAATPNGSHRRNETAAGRPAQSGVRRGAWPPRSVGQWLPQNIGSEAPYPWRMLDRGRRENAVKGETPAQSNNRSANAPMLDEAGCCRWANNMGCDTSQNPEKYGETGNGGRAAYQSEVGMLRERWNALKSNGLGVFGAGGVVDGRGEGGGCDEVEGRRGALRCWRKGVRAGIGSNVGENRR